MIRDLCQSLRKYVKNLPILEQPWELLEFLNNEKLETDLEPRKVEGLPGAEVYCGKNVDIQPYNLFTGKIFLGDNVRIGPFCFIRGTVIVGDNSLIGPHAEVIRTVMGEKSSLAHKNLLGDTIIGNECQIAGLSTVCNVSWVRDTTKIHLPDDSTHIYNGRYGAYIDNGVGMGALTIMMPGTYIRPHAKIIGQSVVYGNSKIKPMVGSKLYG
jgi:UDP-3-O-[3-hydroxymyristoyl] glucosamine N-acyltransferase